MEGTIGKRYPVIGSVVRGTACGTLRYVAEINMNLTVIEKPLDGGMYLIAEAEVDGKMKRVSTEMSAFEESDFYHRLGTREINYIEMLTDTIIAEWVHEYQMYSMEEELEDDKSFAKNSEKELTSNDGEEAKINPSAAFAAIEDLLRNHG